MGGYVHQGLTRKNPEQMAKGDPKKASSYASVDAEATREATASTPKTLGPRSA